jgi:glycosyltransferase involved in cell wall biosynthesis
MPGVRILCCDPEGSSRRGGLSIALQRLVEALQGPPVELWQLQHQPGSYTACCLGRPTQQAPSLEALLPRLQPDLLLAVGWHTWSEAAVGVARRQGIPALFWSHGVGCLNWYSARPLLGALRWCWRAHRLFSVATALLQVDHLVVAYSRTAALDPRSVDEALARRWLARPVTVIGNPVDTHFWRPAGPPHRSSSMVLSVGRLEWQKGHASALRIVLAARTKHLRLSCVAPAFNAYGQQLQRRAARSAQAHRLLLSLGMTAEQRLEHLQRALCLLSWSETEYQSLAMLEALACGCPVIARPRGWLLHGPIPGVLVTNSQRQASIWLDALAADSAWAARLGQEGRAYVERCHALHVVSQQWRALFHHILEPR